MTQQPYHHGDLRNAIVNAARQALRSSTPDQLSLRQLARDAGVSANAPYRHFADREALLLTLTLEGFHSLTEIIAQRTSSGSRPARLVALSTAYQEFAKAEPGVFRLMFRSRDPGRSSPEVDEAIEGLFAEIILAIEGSKPAENAELALRQAVGVWAALHGSTMFLLDGTLDWLDAWLRPTGAELADALRLGFARLSPERSSR